MQFVNDLMILCFIVVSRYCCCFVLMNLLRYAPQSSLRSLKTLIEFRKMLKAERKNGVPVSTLAKRHGISQAYIYLMP